MNAIKSAISRLLRGPGASRLLAGFGIDAIRFWLLMDLFDAISDRGEVTDQFGRNTLALKQAGWIFFAVSGFMTLGFLVARPALLTYFSAFLLATAFLLLTVLASEASNSLVNPAESLVLAHQPINGATYTAAKLSHLLRIVLYLVPGMNALPALAGLALSGAPWFYPVIHLLAALAVGLVAALLCCAAFGWLIRFFPPRRLRAAGQLAAAVPFMSMMLWGQIQRALARAHIGQWLPTSPAFRWGLAAVLGAAAAVSVALGIRSLSADYLVRVSSIMRGSLAGRAKARRPWLGGVVARLFGGQGSRAGFAYVSQMMRRDFQFRRQLFGVIPGVVMGGLLAVRGIRTDPFTGNFTAMHLMPHLLGGLLFMVCSILAYGNDFKGAWIFLLAPTGIFSSFARGVYALMWIEGVIIPHLLVFFPLVWFWGILHGSLFVAYSMAAASTYLALEIRSVAGLPFTRQFQPSSGITMLPLMLLGGLVMAAAVGVQHFLLFRSPAAVLIAAAALSAAAAFLTRGSLSAFEANIRYHLGLLSFETGTLYKEVDV
jgi:hypothetical protein